MQLGKMSLVHFQAQAVPLEDVPSKIGVPGACLIQLIFLSGPARSCFLDLVPQTVYLSFVH